MPSRNLRHRENGQAACDGGGSHGHEAEAQGKLNGAEIMEKEIESFLKEKWLNIGGSEQEFEAKKSLSGHLIEIRKILDDELGKREIAEITGICQYFLEPLTKLERESILEKLYSLSAKKNEWNKAGIQQ